MTSRRCSTSAFGSSNAARLSNGITRPTCASISVPIRLTASRSRRDRRSVGLTWLTSWKRRLFWPSKRTGSTAARLLWTRRPTKGCQGASSARPKGRREVETAPAGKISRQPPATSSARAAARERALVATASRVLAKLIGSTWARTSGIRHRVLMATTRKSCRILATRWHKARPSTTPNGWLATTTSGPCRGMSARRQGSCRTVLSRPRIA